jgi:hypothetical protein
LKVFVDTTKPKLSLEAEADASGQVNAVLIVDDATPLQNIQLRYVTDVLSEWQNVDIRKLPRDGKIQFTPNETWKQISLQVVGTDTPGNQSVITQLLRRPRLAESHERRHAAAAASDSPLVTSAPLRFNSAETARGYSGNTGRVTAGFDGLRGVEQPTPTTTGPPHLVAAPQPQSSSHDRQTQSVRVTPVGQRLPYFGPTSALALPAAATPDQISNGFGLNSPQQTVPETKPVATSPASRRNGARTPAEAMRPLSENSSLRRSIPEEVAAPAPGVNSDAQRHKSMRSTPTDAAIALRRAPHRYSNSERFSLEYELEAVGSRGVDVVELYGSVNGGKSWGLWGKDSDRKSPFDIETQEEGIFGFRIVVVGHSGLASPRPQTGDLPDIVIVVDKQSPQARITGAQYGEDDRIGALVIQYECADSYLTQRPITLSFSDRARGPWTTIAAGLRNDGVYIWPADPKLPRQIFLRIDATDQAGNVGTDILDQPIDVQGLAPRARIRGFQPLSSTQPPQMGEQTAMRPRATFQ